MPTDAERREVARRLRELNSNISHVRRVYEAEGIYVFCDDQADYYQTCYAVAGYLPAEHMHPCDYKELHDLLADLIDPDTTTDTTKSPELTTKCDREALLELADDLDRMGDGSMYDASISDEYGIARCIREALGVER